MARKFSSNARIAVPTPRNDAKYCAKTVTTKRCTTHTASPATIPLAKPPAKKPATKPAMREATIPSGLRTIDMNDPNKIAASMDFEGIVFFEPYLIIIAMGVNLRELITGKEIEWSELRGKNIAVDAMNTLYQFLSTIRQPDGTPLMDASGKITSHMSGLFYRTIRVYENGVKPCYVFDGKPPELKGRELEGRKERKQQAERKWKEAKERGDLEEAKKQAQRTSRFTPEMLKDSKRLIDAMGIPQVQAPSEGETQCAYMCQKGEVYATGTQDYDSLLAGSPTVIRNMTMQEKFNLEKIVLEEVLKSLELTREQLVDVAILVGTDFNPGGVKGIGPKKGYKIVKEGKIDEYKEAMGEKYEAIKEIFLKPDVTDKYDLKWDKANPKEIEKILIDEHSFSEMRVERGIKRLEEAYNQNVSQSSLKQWF